MGYFRLLSDGELEDLRTQGRLEGPLSSVPLGPLLGLVDYIGQVPVSEARQFFEAFRRPKGDVEQKGNVAYAVGSAIGDGGSVVRTLETYRIRD